VLIAFAYNDLMRRIVHAMKFKGRMDIAPVLGRAAVGMLIPVLGRMNVSAVVPIPRHPVRIRDRGFDQNLGVAHGVSTQIGCEVRTDLIRRVRNTRPQTRLPDHERLVNLIGAFAPGTPTKPVPSGKVLLVDDVIHTGTTAAGCLEVLAEIDVGDVSVLAACG